MKEKKNKVKECLYKVNGMHCASCEVLIEKKLIKEKEVEAVEASTSKGEVRIEYNGEKPSITKLNNLFREEGYTFLGDEAKEEKKNTSSFISIKNGSLIIDKDKLSTFEFIFIGILAIYVIYLLLEKLGITSLVSVNSTSSLLSFLLFGIIAGMSSCAALVGGIVLSMSKQWYELHANSNSFIEKAEPHILFSIGRLVSFVVLGGVLGAIGSLFTLSPVFNAILVIVVSIMMVLLGFQILGIKALQRFQFTTPKFISRYISDESNFTGKYMPFIMGALTFFLPCGFTITAQGLAMASGSPIRGALIMLFFALGTSPMLLFIGLSSTKLYSKAKVAENFMKLVGILVILFGLSNLNNQFVVLGLPNLKDLQSNASIAVDASDNTDNTTPATLPEIVDGEQIVKMQASSSGYTPNYITVKVNVPVKWEITDAGASGCTSSIVSSGLFSGSISLTNGQVSTKEFTPTKVGKYRFSCPMGMITGVIEVVDTNDASPTNTNFSNSDIVPSGSTSCGCGGSN